MDFKLIITALLVIMIAATVIGIVLTKKHGKPTRFNRGMDSALSFNI